MHKPLNKDPVIFTNHELVVEPTHLENMLVKLDLFSQGSGVNINDI